MSTLSTILLALGLITLWTIRVALDDRRPRKYFDLGPDLRRKSTPKKAPPSVFYPVAANYNSTVVMLPRRA